MFTLGLFFNFSRVSSLQRGGIILERVERFYKYDINIQLLFSEIFKVVKHTITFARFGVVVGLKY